MLVGVTERITDKTVIRIAKKRDQEWTDRLLLDHVDPKSSFVFHDGWDGYHGIDLCSLDINTQSTSMITETLGLQIILKISGRG